MRTECTAGPADGQQTVGSVSEEERFPDGPFHRQDGDTVETEKYRFPILSEIPKGKEKKVLVERDVTRHYRYGRKKETRVQVWIDGWYLRDDDRIILGGKNALHAAPPEFTVPKHRDGYEKHAADFFRKIAAIADRR